MTEQEAKDWLKVLGLPFNNADKRVEAIDVGIKALEKQIAKKPSEPQGIWINKRCPSCMRTIATNHEGKKYCVDCGQKLDWGNEDDRD